MHYTGKWLGTTSTAYSLFSVKLNTHLEIKVLELAGLLKK